MVGRACQSWDLPKGKRITPFPKNSGCSSPAPFVPFFLHVFGEIQAGNLRSLETGYLGALFFKQNQGEDDQEAVPPPPL